MGLQVPRRLDVTSGPGASAMVRALSLSFGAAIALGVARFSYALLLPGMKADLGWSFAQAGALNTSNAVGYLVGALSFPVLSRHVAPERLFLAGCVLTTLLMAGAGFTLDFDLLLAQRLACGVFSALIFVAGGLLAARLATAEPHRSGLVLGLFYSGVGWGIVISALIAPWSEGAGRHGWQSSWIALSSACAVCTALAWPAARSLEAPAVGRSVAAAPPSAAGASRYAWLLLAYGLFGIGYIGYMTFVIALLRGGGLGAAAITAFFVALGLSTAASGRIWSGVLHRARGGGAFALFCFLLGSATLAPALTGSPIAAFASGILFGATFLSVVTSTTAFVRHNLPPSNWPVGVSLFTIVFALGQIVGPVAFGSISDGSSLSRGFLYSGAVLWAGAAFALAQRPLRREDA